MKIEFLAILLVAGLVALARDDAPTRAFLVLAGVAGLVAVGVASHRRLGSLRRMR